MNKNDNDNDNAKASGRNARNGYMEDHSVRQLWKGRGSARERERNRVWWSEGFRWWWGESTVRHGTAQVCAGSPGMVFRTP